MFLNDINYEYYYITPRLFYNEVGNNYNFGISPSEVFEFSDSVKLNAKNYISNYISIHLRLGDKYLETDRQYILCTNDCREYVESKLFECIESNLDKNIVFFCDNNSYRLKIKDKYKNIIITDCEIGHTGLLNTTDKQTLDAVTEFYIISRSEKIYAVSRSGFSMVASSFNNIPLINLY